MRTGCALRRPSGAQTPDLAPPDRGRGPAPPRPGAVAGSARRSRGPLGGAARHPRRRAPRPTAPRPGPECRPRGAPGSPAQGPGTPHSSRRGRRSGLPPASARSRGCARPWPAPRRARRWRRPPLPRGSRRRPRAVGPGGGTRCRGCRARGPGRPGARRAARSPRRRPPAHRSSAPRACGAWPAGPARPHGSAGLEPLPCQATRGRAGWPSRGRRARMATYARLTSSRARKSGSVERSAARSRSRPASAHPAVVDRFYGRRWSSSAVSTNSSWLDPGASLHGSPMPGRSRWPGRHRHRDRPAAVGPGRPAMSGAENDVPLHTPKPPRKSSGSMASRARPNAVGPRQRLRAALEGGGQRAHHRGARHVARAPTVRRC